MQDNYTFYPNEINLSALRSYSSRMADVEEQIVCELAEIASSMSSFIKNMLDEGLGYYDIFYMLGDALPEIDVSVGEHTLKENHPHLLALSNLAQKLDRSILCSLLLEYLENINIHVSERGFFSQMPRDESFVYVKNAFSDEAYDVFSQEFNDPRVRYADSFKEALRLVSDNAVTFCLLPIEERGARIPSIDELIFRGDFKINSVIPVFGYDGNAEMKYALVSKNIFFSDFSPDDDRYFEIRIPSDREDALSSIIISSEEFGVRLYRINSQIFKTEEGERSYFSIVLKSLGGDFSKLLVYLTLFLPEYTPVGIYKNLE